MKKNLVPTVSVIIPTYNRAHVVGQAIQSVLDQTYQDFEIIVLDDASADHTEEIVKSFQDSRICYIRHLKNRGAPWARNSGAQAAQGEFLAFLDSDDFWYPEFLERQFAELLAHPECVGMSCCNIVRTTGESRTVLRPGARSLTFDENIIFANGICTSSFLIRKFAFQSVGGFDVMYSSFQDFDFLLRMTAKYRIEAIDDILLEYHIGDDSISRNMVAKAKGFDRIINIYHDDILRLRLMHIYLFRLGQYHILSGYRLRGWKCWAQALQFKALDAKIWKHFLLTLGGVGLYRCILFLHTRSNERQHT